jgi:CoA:oxalate CoA-transferase
MSQGPLAGIRVLLPEALTQSQDAIVTAGRFRLIGSPIRISGYHPDYRPPP